MEGQQQLSYSKKRVFTFLPIILTLALQPTILEASTHPIPFPPFAVINLTQSAVPIFANTFAAINNLKSLQSMSSNSVELERKKGDKILGSEKAVLSKSDDKAATEASQFTLSNLSRLERRQYVANFAESQTDLGIHYRYGGTSMQSGIDCSGFTRYVLDYFDLKISRTAQEQFDAGNKVPVEMSKPGDLVFFGKKSVSHVAVVVSNGKDGLVVVHSCNRGIIKENITESKYWRSKLREDAVNVIDNSSEAKPTATTIAEK